MITTTGAVEHLVLGSSDSVLKDGVANEFGQTDGQECRSDPQPRLSRRDASVAGIDVWDSWPHSTTSTSRSVCSLVPRTLSSPWGAGPALYCGGPSERCVMHRWPLDGTSAAKCWVAFGHQCRHPSRRGWLLDPTSRRFAPCSCRNAERGNLT